MASVATRGRGIGRGRGFGVSKTQERPGDTTEEKKNLSSDKAAEGFDLTQLLNDLREESLDEKVDKLSKYISASSDSSTKIKQVIDQLNQRSMKDSEFAPLAAKVANKLCSEESYGNTFRGLLLKSTQENYKNRESIRNKSRSEWIGLVGLICELFNQLRTGQAPLKPLAGAVHQTMSELLRDVDSSSQSQEEDETDCFYQQFKTVGKLLESVDQVSYSGKIAEYPAHYLHLIE